MKKTGISKPDNFNPVGCKCIQTIGLIMAFKTWPTGQEDIEVRCPVCDKGVAYEALDAVDLRVEFDGEGLIQIVKRHKYGFTRKLAKREKAVEVKSVGTKK